MIKNIVAVSLTLLLALGCQRQVGYNEVDIDEPLIVCPDSTMWNYTELEVQLRNIYQKYPWINKIYLDDTLEIMRVNFDIEYEYVHSGWDGKILTIDIMRTLNTFEKVCSSQIPHRDNCLVSVNYNYKSTNTNTNEAIYYVKLPLWEFGHYDKLLYLDFTNYVLEQMTPSDFQAYDHALEELYEDKKDDRFNTNFYKLIVELSENNKLSKDEEFVLDKMTAWALSKPKTETRKHFDYFRNQVVEASKRVDAENSY